MAPWWSRKRTRRPDPPGTGVWRRADDRFRRAVDRYDQALARIETVALAPETAGGAPADESSEIFRLGIARLQSAGAELAALAARVHEVYVSAHALGPSDGEDIPPGPGGMLLDVHRALARAATLVAQASESVTMALVAGRAGRGEEAGSACRAAERAVHQAGAQVTRAESMISDATSADQRPPP